MPKKRGNSEGTVCLRTDGRWEAKVTVTIAEGKQKRKHAYSSTQREALEKLAKLRGQQIADIPFAHEKLTLGQRLKSWLQNQKPPAVKPKTYIAYEYQSARHLIPALGRIPLSKLTPQDVRDFMQNRLEQGLSPKTVRHFRATLRAALNAAIADGLLQRNVATLTKPPKLEKKSLIVYMPEEARAFLRSAEGHRLEALFTTAVSIALREGEILGLQWPDINFERGILTVQRNLQRVKRVRLGQEARPGERRTEVLLVTPKTPRSRRTITLPDILLESLKAHWQKQREERLLAGSIWRDTNYVFTSTVGTALDQRRLTRVFSQIAGAARLPDESPLPKIRFHDLRHSAASLLIAQGVHPRAIMELLGHSTITLTMDTYGHLFESVNRETAEKMDAILRPVGVSVGVKRRLERVK